MFTRITLRVWPPEVIATCLTFTRHPQRGEKSDSRWEVVDDDAGVVD